MTTDSRGVVWATRVTVGALAVALAWVAVTTFQMIEAHVIAVPIWDHWQAVLPEEYLKKLWSQHNEHRLVVGRIFFALDAWLFRSRSYLTFGVIYLSLFATAFLIAWAAAPITNPRKFVPVVLVSLTLLFAAYNFDVLLSPFQASFVPQYPAAIGAFSAMARLSVRRGLVFATLLGTFAALTMANGVLVLPLLVAFAFVSGRPRWVLGALGVVSVALVAIYLYGYETPRHHAHPWSSVRHPAAAARYLLVYFGGPLSWRFGAHRFVAAEILGALALVAWASIAIFAVRRRRTSTASDWVLPFMMTFIVGTGVLTALGRANFALDQALSSRYGAPVLSFWAALLAYAIRSSVTTAARMGSAAAAALVGLWLASEQLHHERTAGGQWELYRRAETAILVGALDVQALNFVTFAPHLVEDSVPKLRARRWWVFAEPWLDWIGSPVSTKLKKRDDAACIGGVERGHAVRTYGAPGYRIDGWAYSLVDRAPAERLVFIDQHGIVVGFGLAGYWRPEIPSRVREVRTRRAGFIGHVGSITEDAVIEVVALVDGGRTACHLSPVVRLARARP